MSLPEHTEDLLRSLHATTALLQELEQALRERRLIWVAARPRELREPLQDLDHIARELHAEAGRRDRALQALAALLPLPAPRPGCDLNVTVRMLAQHLPRVPAQRLQAAAAAAVAAARAVRVETALGGRLLQFAQRAHESWLPHVCNSAKGPVAYDRRARKAQAAPRGALIDGRL
jgi:hypothetical protein